MFSKPYSIIAIAFFLAGGLIVSGLGYPYFLSEEGRTSSDSVSVTEGSPFITMTQPIVSIEDNGSRKWKDDTDDGDDDDDKRRAVETAGRTTGAPDPAPVPSSSSFETVRPASSPSVSPNVTNANNTRLLLTTEEIASHASISSCWVIIHDKVYDVTGLVNSHSGGAKAILDSCGKDGSVMFDTKGNKNRPHSSSASQILSSFYIGDLGGYKVK